MSPGPPRGTRSRQARAGWPGRERQGARFTPQLARQRSPAAARVQMCRARGARETVSAGIGLVPDLDQYHDQVAGASSEDDVGLSGQQPTMGQKKKSRCFEPCRYAVADGAASVPARQSRVRPPSAIGRCGTFCRDIATVLITAPTANTAARANDRRGQNTRGRPASLPSLRAGSSWPTARTPIPGHGPPREFGMRGGRDHHGHTRSGQHGRSARTRHADLAPEYFLVGNAGVLARPNQRLSASSFALPPPSSTRAIAVTSPWWASELAALHGCRRTRRWPARVPPRKYRSQVALTGVRQWNIPG